ncbi:MAG TPA: sigma factor, partial [Candidatus Cybelea sp.]|nr:sigma factor [Candidatus Cybelea sp.]
MKSTLMTLDENSAALALAAVPRRVTSSGYNARLAKSLKAGGDTTESAPDIRALTQAIKSGDAAAFARFYDLYSFRLYRFLLVLTRGNENAAREICQTALTKLAKRFEVFDDERKLWAWLCMLAKNSFIDHYRAQRRRDCLVSLEHMPASIASAEQSTGQLS